MDSHEEAFGFYGFVKRNWPAIGFGVLGVILFGYGLISYLSSSDSSNEIIFEAGEDSISEVENQGSGEGIVIDIEGAVVNPGVYEVSSGSRISDAILAAGGLSEYVDNDWISKNLNMAAKLSDGVKIYIPNKGEDVEGVVNNSSTGVNGSSGVININSASGDDLDSLPGIGPVTTQKIIDNRPYETIEELKEKKIVGNKVFNDIKEKISVF